MNAEDEMLRDACITGGELVYIRCSTDDVLVARRLPNEPDEALHHRLCVKGLFPACPQIGMDGHRKVLRSFITGTTPVHRTAAQRFVQSVADEVRSARQ